MKRDTLLALVIAVGLHAAVFFGGQFLKSAPVRPPAPGPDEPIPVIELLPLSQTEPAPAGSAVDSSGGGAAADEQSAVAKPEVAATAAGLIENPFLPPIAPPALPGVGARGGVVSLPAGLAGAAGGGFGHGQGNLFNLADLDRAPTPTLRVPPTYPFEMRRAGVSGEAVVGFIVDASGRVRDAYAVSASRREFADEAVRAVLKWQFTPGRKNGLPVGTRMQVPLVFNLETN